jgi:hypothetical protein
VLLRNIGSSCMKIKEGKGKKQINTKSEGITPHVLSREVDPAMKNQKTPRKVFFFCNYIYRLNRVKRFTRYIVYSTRVCVYQVVSKTT